MKNHVLRHLVLILVNTTSSSTNGAGQSITSTDLGTFGYDNATAGQSGFDVYDSSTSSDPSYQTGEKIVKEHAIIGFIVIMESALYL